MGDFPSFGQSDEELTAEFAAVRGELKQVADRVTILEGNEPEPEPEPEDDLGIEHAHRADYSENVAPIWGIPAEEWVFGRGPGDDYTDPNGGPWESLPQAASVAGNHLDNLRTDRDVTGYVALVRDRTIRAEVTFRAQGAKKPDSVPNPTPTDHMDGHFVTWPDRPAATHEAEARLRNGKQFQLCLEHVSEVPNSPCATDASWFLNWYQGTSYRLSITLRGYSWAGNADAAARGEYEWAWREQVKQIRDMGYEDAILRPLHEMNCCYRWGEDAKQNPGRYINIFKRYANVIRSENPQAPIDWCPIFEPNFGVTEKYYPGNDYCDIVGMDTYSRRDQMTDNNLWNSFFLPGLTGHRDFAIAHGKKTSFPEFGVDRHDDALFMERMRAWIKDPANVCLYDVVYEDDNQEYQTRLNNKPNASAKYRASVS